MHVPCTRDTCATDFIASINVTTLMLVIVIVMSMDVLAGVFLNTDGRDVGKYTFSNSSHE